LAAQLLCAVEPGYAFTPEYLYREFMLRPILEKLAQLQTYNVVAIAQTLPATAASVKNQFYDRAIKQVGVVSNLNAC
jgi:hypothetical protein